MDLGLEGKWALVCGASKGLGLGCAQALVQEGVNVLIVARGLEVLDKRLAGKMLVSGVDPEVKPGEFAAEFGVAAQRMECCVTLGYAAVDTRSNAAETAKWVAQNEVTSLRLVTTDWHMRRAASELERALPDHVRVIRDAVPSQPDFGTLFLEYHKLLASRAAGLADL